MKFFNLEDYLNFGENPAKDAEFESKIREYNAYFSSEIKSKLPDKFLKEYYLYHGFHDWKLTSIKVDLFNGNSTVLVSLFDDYKSIKKTVENSLGRFKLSEAVLYIRTTLFRLLIMFLSVSVAFVNGLLSNPIMLCMTEMCVRNVKTPSFFRRISHHPVYYN